MTIRWTQDEVDAYTKGKPMPSMSEAKFQRTVMKIAVQLNWLIYHTHNSIGSAAGFPDLCMVKDRRYIMAELKTEKGKVSVEQQRWIDALKRTAIIEVYLWRPSMMEEIVEILR